MATWPIFQIATFSDQPFAGNPTFVLVAEVPMKLEVADLVRAQLGEQVLTVITQGQEAPQVEFVTKNGYHSGPAHSMHAAAWVAFNRLDQAGNSLDLRLSGGGVRRVHRDGSLISVEWARIPSRQSGDRQTIASAIGLVTVETLHSSFGTVAVVESEEALLEMVPDLAAISALDSETLIVTAPSAVADFIIRVFAPRLDLPEDPVCGTAHRVIAPYWAQRLGRMSLTARQGSPRGGEVLCQLSDDRILISGRAVPFLEGRIDCQL